MFGDVRSKIAGRLIAIWQELEPTHIIYFSYAVYSAALGRFILHGPFDKTRDGAMALVGLGFLLSLGEHVRLKLSTSPDEESQDDLRRILVYGNALLVTLLYFLTNTLESQFFLFYCLPIVGAAINLTITDIWKTTLAAGLGLGVVAFALAKGGAGQGKEWDYVTVSVLLPRIVLLCVVALVASQLKRAQTAQKKLHDALSAVLPATASASLLDRALDDLLDGVMKLGFDCGVIGLIDESMGTIAVVRARNVSPRQVAMSRYSLSKTDDIMVRVVNEKITKFFPAGHYDPSFNLEIYKAFGHDRLARVFVPLKIRPEGGARVVVGTLECGCYGSDATERVKEKQVEVEQLVQQYAPTIAKLRTYVLLTTIAEHAFKIIDADSASIHVFRGPKMLYQAGAGKATHEFLSEFPPRRDGIGRAAMTARKIEIADEDRLKAEYPQLIEKGVMALAAFPLLNLGEPGCVGVLYVHFWRRRTFSAKERQVERLFAQQLEGVIQSYLSLSTARMRIRHLELLRGVYETIDQHSNVGDLVQTIAAQVVNTMACDQCNIYLKDRAENHAVLRVQGAEGRFAAMGRTVPVGSVPPKIATSPVFRAFEGGRAIVQNGSDPRGLPIGEENQRRSRRSIVAAPIFAGDHRIGVVAVEKNETSYFGEEDKLLVSAVARCTGNAIQRDRGLELIRDVGAAILGPTRVEEVLQRIVSGVVSVMDVDTAAIFLDIGSDAGNASGQSSTRRFAKFGHPQQDLPDPRPGGLTSQIMASGELLPIPNLKTTSIDVSDRIRNDYDSLIGFPLVLGTRHAGALFLFSKTQRTFSDSEKSLLQSLTNQAAQVIQKARRLELAHVRLESSEHTRTELLKLIGTNELGGALFHYIKSPASHFPASCEKLENALLGMESALQSIGGLVSDPSDRASVEEGVRKALASRTRVVESLTQLRAGSRRIDELTTRVSTEMERHAGGDGALAPIAIRDLLTRAVDNVTTERALWMQSVEVRRAFEECAIEVETHEAMVTEAIANVIANAFDAVESKDGAYVAIAAVEEPNGVTISIEDNGKGIAEEDRERIFDLNFTKGKNRGVGFGLWWTRRVMRATGIDISFVSKVGIGTTFRLTVPIGGRKEGETAHVGEG